MTFMFAIVSSSIASLFVIAWASLACIAVYMSAWRITQLLNAIAICILCISQVWAVILGVHYDHTYRERYAKALSTTSEETSGDGTDAKPDAFCGKLDAVSVNQIAVDLPRCHAYDSIIASPIGKDCLRRVLIATLSLEGEQLVYIQVGDAHPLCVCMCSMTCFWSEPSLHMYPTSIGILTRGC